MRAPEGLTPAPPISPGEVLRDQFLAELNWTQDQLAAALCVSRLSVNQIVNGHRAITAEMALRLAYVTSTTPGFWLNLQRNLDLYQARQKLEKTLPKLKVLREPKSDVKLFKDVE